MGDSEDHMRKSEENGEVEMSHHRAEPNDEQVKEGQESTLESKYIQALEAKIKLLEEAPPQWLPISPPHPTAKPLPVPNLEITRTEHEAWRALKPFPGLVKGGALLVSSTSNTTFAHSMNEIGGKPTRLAVNSDLLLNLLARVTGEPFSATSNVIVRPFRHLVYNENKIRQALQQAEEKRLDPNEATDLDEQARAQRMRDELRLLIDFMDKDMADIFAMRKQIETPTLRPNLTTIAFEYLWLLFKPGDILLQSSSRPGRNHLQFYTVLQATGGRSLFPSIRSNGIPSGDGNLVFEDSDSEQREKHHSSRSLSGRFSSFVLDCVYVDSDGFRLGPKAKRFIIPLFAGTKPIRSLGVYPAIFHPEYKSIMDRLVKRGKKLVKVSSGSHRQYSGMTIRDSQRVSTEYESDLREVPAEEADLYKLHSEVMIDQAAGINHFITEASMEFKFGGIPISVPFMQMNPETFEPFSLRINENRGTDILDDAMVNIDRRAEFLASTSLLDLFTIDSDDIPDIVLAHLKPRVYGFGMRVRKWLPLDIDCVSQGESQSDLSTSPKTRYNDLILPKGHKKLLQALVSFHTQDRGNWYSFENSSMLSMDVVSGKGEGLFILLHGPPGVGKTSTAECVAAQLGRPLLQITCGDLGDHASTMEKKLETFCRLAYKWRCVLLVDEADVFLTKREKSDFDRNAKIGVFLRALDYYPGVMIFTSNRVGQIDEAFRSRIHLCLFFPKLDNASFMRIWAKAIARLKRSHPELDIDDEGIRDFAKLLWLENEKHPSRHWNGRQIKNAFQTAIALANFDFQEAEGGNKSKKPTLKAAHFKRIGEASAHFDDYIGNLYGLEDQDAYAVLAAREEIRKDVVPLTTFMNSKQPQIRTRGMLSRKSTLQDYSNGSDSDIERTGSEDESDLDDGQSGENTEEEDGDKQEMLKLKKRLAKLEKKQGKERRKEKNW